MNESTVSMRHIGDTDGSYCSVRIGEHNLNIRVRKVVRCAGGEQSKRPHSETKKLVLENLLRLLTSSHPVPITAPCLFPDIFNKIVEAVGHASQAKP